MSPTLSKLIAKLSVLEKKKKNLCFNDCGLKITCLHWLKSNTRIDCFQSHLIV